MVDVRDVDPHAIPLVIQPAHEGEVDERAVPVVAVELVRLVRVVGQVQVLVSVVVVVEEDATHAHSGVEGS